ncbi:MAG TPA: LLM class flavin-dependent oxidoreductase [Thermomicrobiales bacterium]
MQFSLAIDHRDWVRSAGADGVAATFRLAELADRAGFDSLWINEDPDGWDAFAVLGAIAARTERIRLGTGVVNPFGRHPNLIAASVATLDRLAPGRAFLGLGRGQPEWHERALGVAPHSPLALLEETATLLDQWWSPPYRANAGEPIPVRNWERSIHPTTRPPRYLAAVGPKALNLAGRRFDGVLFNEMASDAFLRKAIATVKDAAMSVGRDPGQLRFFANPAVTVTDDPEPVYERKKVGIALIHALPGMDRLLDVPGYDIEGMMRDVRRVMRVDEILAEGGGFPELRERGNLSAARALIPTDLVSQLVVVGPLPYVRRRLAELANFGVTDVFLDRRGLPRDQDQLRQLLADLQIAA